MTNELALHTAARRYCEERAIHWHTRYAELGYHRSFGDYSDAEKDVFPRYNVLDAILVEVERLRPEAFASGQEAREMLALAGQVGESIFTQPPNGPIQERAMQEEQNLFSTYISNLDSDALAQVEPMPSRRTLSEAESKTVWERVNQRWRAAGGYWYPLSGDAPPDAVAFDAYAFDKNIPAALFQNILARRGIHSVFELREYGPEYEMETTLVLPFYNGAEGYWTEGELDWLVYASHESTVTVAGAWLIHSVQQQWPTWSEHLVQW